MRGLSHSDDIISICIFKINFIYKVIEAETFKQTNRSFFFFLNSNKFKVGFNQFLINVTLHILSQCITKYVIVAVF